MEGRERAVSWVGLMSRIGGRGIEISVLYATASDPSLIMQEGLVGGGEVGR